MALPVQQGRWLQLPLESAEEGKAELLSPAAAHKG